MNCNVRPGKKFLKEFKRLYKHYKSLKGDVDALVVSLKDNPTQGADLGGGIRKVRMAITSKGKGKSGGARVITLTVLVSVTDLDVWLLTLYDKSERETITDSEIAELRRQEGLYPWGFVGFLRFFANSNQKDMRQSVFKGFNKE